MCHNNETTSAVVETLQPDCDLSHLKVEDRPLIASSQDIAELFFSISHFDRELMVSGGVDANGRLIYWEIVAEVASDAPVLSDTNPFRKALELGAASIFLVHNHKSNSLKPTIEDLELTEAVARAGMLLKIPLSDHVIVSEKGSYSILHPDALQAMSCSVIKPSFQSMRKKELLLRWNCGHCKAVNRSTAMSQIKTVLKGISTPVTCVRCQAPAWLACEFEIAKPASFQSAGSFVEQRRGSLRKATSTVS